jgi:hypothetical protein
MVGTVLHENSPSSCMSVHKHHQLLNPQNGLVACRIDSTIPTDLTEQGLDLTKRLFPDEPQARDRLGAVYKALVRDEHILDGFEALDYYTYALPQSESLHVVGIGGLYRLLSLDDEDMAMASTVSTFLVRNFSDEVVPVGVSRGPQELMTSLIWGGRMGMSPRVSRSRAVSSFIYQHIFTSVLSTIERLKAPPIMLLFARRDDNRPLLRLYENMGFVNTGAQLTYLDQPQAVFAIHLHRDTPVLHFLRELTERDLRRER